ncbi:MAG: chorismate synthase [Tissierellia bacterium]|nr:chorismate synthase [Tissierellia bacterium]
MKYRSKQIRIMINGGSHSDKIEFSLDGIKKGHDISLDRVQEFLDRRSSSGKSYTTQRKEKDKVHIIEGLSQGKSDGRIIKGYFNNEDTRSKDYSIFKDIPRPSHIDYVALKKFGRDFDLAGSGEFSGRLTVAIVAAGAICLQILEEKGIFIGSHFLKLFDIEDYKFDPIRVNKEELDSLDKNLPLLNKNLEDQVYTLVEEFREKKDSFGGIVELAILGDLAFMGNAYFDRLQAKLSRLLLAIPGSKGIEFGNGFEASSRKASDNNDSWVIRDNEVKTRTNRAGGLNGGIANGMPIILRLAFKPTSSISKRQESVDLKEMTNTSLEIQGRHDPAFILRTPPVVEALTAIGLLDIVYEEEKKTLRDKIDSLDQEIMSLYVERIKLTDQVGRKKAETKEKVDQPQREKEILDGLKDKYPDYTREIDRLYSSIFHDSKRRQENIIKYSKSSYGLIGRKLDYSYSKEIHELMAPYNYDLIELMPDQVGDFLKKENLKGLNVTIPYKQEVIKYLDFLSKEAKEIGGVNTIKYDRGKKLGFNTDFYGFKKLLIEKKIFVKDKKVLILGTGATSRTVEAVLKNMKAKEIAFVSRKGPIDYDNIYDLKGYEIMVNTTPVGTNDDSPTTLVDFDRLKGIEFLVDVVYNPIHSRLVFEARRRNIKAYGGLEMLFYQAKKTVEIFTGQKMSYHKAIEFRNQVFDSKLNLVLVGMPGSGKTTIGRNLAKSLNKIHVDLDDEFFKTYGIRPADALLELGEEKFRTMEIDISRKVGKKTNLVISTGGGVVTRQENYFYLKQNSIIIYIDRDIRKLSTRNRPISQGGLGQLKRLKESRLKNYQMFADYRVVNNGYFRKALEEIILLYKEKIIEV